MSLLTLIVVLLILGVFLLIVNIALPNESKVKSFLNVVVVVAVWVLQLYSLFESLKGAPIYVMTLFN